MWECKCVNHIVRMWTHPMLKMVLCEGLVIRTSYCLGCILCEFSKEVQGGHSKRAHEWIEQVIFWSADSKYVDFISWCCWHRAKTQQLLHWQDLCVRIDAPIIWMLLCLTVYCFLFLCWQCVYVQTHVESMPTQYHWGAKTVSHPASYTQENNVSSDWKYHAVYNMSKIK